MAGMSPTQRTMRVLRVRGTICEVVERFNSYAGKYGQRHDLFNIIDILALDPELGVGGIQCCGISFKNHIDKIIQEKAQETYDWLNTPGTYLEIWGWRKVKLHRGGKAMRWKARIGEIFLNENKEIKFIEKNKEALK